MYRVLLTQHGCPEVQLRQPLGLVVPNRLPPLPHVDCRLDNATEVRVGFTHLYEADLEQQAQQLMRTFHNFMIHP